MVSPGRMLRVEGATENNLRDVDVTLPEGITAVVGVSGSGKSSLAFDTVHHESRRRFLETLSLGSPALRYRPARVRTISGLRPAVAVAQNVVNANPRSTVATALGVHPFLRLLYARFAQRRCPACAEPANVATPDTQLETLRGMLSGADAGPVDVLAVLVRGTHGSHRRLLAYLAERFEVEVDGQPWTGTSLDPNRAHDILVQVDTAKPEDNVRTLRGLLDSVVALGALQVVFARGAQRRALSRAPVCPRCGTRLQALRPADFHSATADTSGYRLTGRTFDEFVGLDADAALAALNQADLPPVAAYPVRHVRRRLSAVSALGVGYLALDRPSPTLSRGEAQRLRLAVILAADVEDLLHVVDEPTIGLDPAQVNGVMRELARLRGPVLLVEHDPGAVALADHVVELGPGAGPHGGRPVFEGTPADLWWAHTPSGDWFSGRSTVVRRERRTATGDQIHVRGAALHNLRGFDCPVPLGVLTVVTGPSGAGKTTLVRDVLAASIAAGRPVGCSAVEGPSLRLALVDQAPIGRNPRSNPATYTGLAERIRAIFAAGTGAPGSAFSFNRPEGRCPACEGVGAIEVRLSYLPSEWITCDACQGRRFDRDVRDLRVTLADGAAYTVDQVFDTTVDDAMPLFADDAKARRVLRALHDVGLGYVRLGQPSPTLSGGEAQRVKLAKHLAVTKAGQLVVLDEPSTGLHPANLSQLLTTLHALTDQGRTVVVIEHHPEVVAAADWLVRLGPGGGPHGGELIYAGPADCARGRPPAPRRSPRSGRQPAAQIRIRGAKANNLRDISVTLPKQQRVAIVGVSGSGKSSLIHNVLEAEANRRLLECLSMYERQSVREGPLADLTSLTGLGPTVAVGPQRRLWNPRSTAGTATELSFHLGVLLAYAGERSCARCGGTQRRDGPGSHSAWSCMDCGAAAPPVAPADFSPATYASACARCHGMGTVSVPRPERLIVRPDRPLGAGAMYSPGFYPESYLTKPANGGYWMLRALGARYGFDPETTPWHHMSEAARDAFLYGEEEVTLPPDAKRSAGRTVLWRGFYLIVSGWDVGGLYTEQTTCPRCEGARLRPDLLEVRLAGMNRHRLHHEPVGAVTQALASVAVPELAPTWVARSYAAASARLRFLARVGLGYLHLDRLSTTLSAGEVQRVKLTALLGSDLTGMTILLDEPSRGLHPSEIATLSTALDDLRDAGNTVIYVDHDPGLLAGADHLVVLGPAAGEHGGRVVASGPAVEVHRDPAGGRLLEPVRPARLHAGRRAPTDWIRIRKPTENNLTGDNVRLPLGVLAGVCGVSGSGKSTLVSDILARALAPVKLTSSVAQEAVNPGAHEAIEGAPARVVHADQSHSGIGSPGAFLGVLTHLRRAYADSDDALSGGLTDSDLTPRCDACKGRGAVREDMSFLPAIERTCDVCEGTGYRADARALAVRGLSLPALAGQTLAQVLNRWGDLEPVAGPLGTAVRLGLGYLTLGQPASSLSGGERQRLKLCRALAQPARTASLYILDEPTHGLHQLDIEPLAESLHALVEHGHSALIVDHDPVLLGCCDQLVELGPGGGPDGGRVIATGTPEELAAGTTPTAPYLREVLGP